jgi:GNAT superfamily N-acetyltransferase
LTVRPSAGREYTTESGVSFSHPFRPEEYLSEYYTLRRQAIKDVTGLIAFIIGWFASAPFGWPYIIAGFETGAVTKGVAQFLVAVFGGACLAGLTGLALGSVGGFVWERVHRALRARRPPSPQSLPGGGLAPAGVDAASLASRPPLPPIRYDEGPMPIDDYVALVQRVSPESVNTTKAAAALERTINIGAWHDSRLVGVARVLTDGYVAAALADLMVDPEYRRGGVGRELMNRAFERTPRGSLFAGARVASAPFFDRIGCERGPTGFTMHRAAKPRGT